MNVPAIIRATGRWFFSADPMLGECHVAVRLAQHRETVRRAGLHREHDYQARVRAGLRWQREQHFRPIPRHRALVIAGPRITAG